MNVMTYIHMRHIDFRHSIVCDRGQFFSLTKPRGWSVKVCRLKIKQMFMVVICVQKNKHSSNPLSTTKTISVCWASVHSELCLSASRTMGSLNAHRSLRRTRQLCISLILSLSPPVKGARQR